MTGVLIRPFAACPARMILQKTIMAARSAMASFGQSETPEAFSGVSCQPAWLVSGNELPPLIWIARRACPLLDRRSIARVAVGQIEDKPAPSTGDRVLTAAGSCNAPLLVGVCSIPRAASGEV